MSHTVAREMKFVFITVGTRIPVVDASSTNPTITYHIILYSDNVTLEITRTSIGMWSQLLPTVSFIILPRSKTENKK